jgi:hypothetical protein
MFSQINIAMRQCKILLPVSFYRTCNPAIADQAPATADTHPIIARSAATQQSGCIGAGLLRRYATNDAAAAGYDGS